MGETRRFDRRRRSNDHKRQCFTKIRMRPSSTTIPMDTITSSVGTPQHVEAEEPQLAGSRLHPQQLEAGNYNNNMDEIY